MNNLVKDLITATLVVIVGILIFLTITSVAESATYQIKDPERLIIVPMEINGDILAQTKRIEELSLKSKEPIDILVNSYGGSVIMGSIFIGAMERAKLRGVRLNCIVTGFAMSMGYHIVSHCDKRMALEYSYLLFHEAYIGYMGQLTKTVADLISKRLIVLTDKLEQYTKSVMKISDIEFDKHNRLETIWTAEELARQYPAFITIISDCKGLPAGVNVLEGLVPGDDKTLKNLLKRDQIRWD